MIVCKSNRGLFTIKLSVAIIYLVIKWRMRRNKSDDLEKQGTINEYKVGICFDQVEYERFYFNDRFETHSYA